MLAAMKIWEPKIPGFPNELKDVMELLPLFGWLLSYGLLLSIYNSYRSIENTVSLYDRVGTGSEGLARVARVALAPSLFGSRGRLAALPPLRSETWTHLGGHAVPWIVVFLSLLTWPIVVSKSTFPQVFEGTISIPGWWYVPFVFSLGSFFYFLIRHYKECKRNDHLGLENGPGAP
jgi:hypothetical protein